MTQNHAVKNVNIWKKKWKKKEIREGEKVEIRENIRKNKTKEKQMKWKEMKWKGKKKNVALLVCVQSSPSERIWACADVQWVSIGRQPSPYSDLCARWLKFMQQKKYLYDILLVCIQPCPSERVWACADAPWVSIERELSPCDELRARAESNPHMKK